MVVKNERKRYLLVEFFGQIPDKRDLVYALRNNVATLGGQLALAQSSLHVVDIMGSFAIIRATHLSRDLVEASIQLLKYNNTIPVVRSVSGTIAKTRKFHQSLISQS